LVYILKNIGGMMKRLHIALILLAGSIFILGLAGAADNTFGAKNLPQDNNREKPDGYMCQPSYFGDCANRPSGTYCMVYSDGYIWAIPDAPARGVWDKAGSWNGKRVEVIHGKKADYYHVLGTSLVSMVEPSEKDNYKSPVSNHNATQAQAASDHTQTLNQPAGSDQPQGQVALTVYVHEGDFNGTMLPGVEITGQDAEGNSFEEVTDSKGAAVIEGQTGTWQLSFAKEGYEPLDLNYDVTQTDEAAAYLQRANLTQSQEQVALTVYIHEGDLNGTMLSGVQITGQDAEGNSFEEVTDFNGSAVIEGQPGAWQFSFAKEGYETLDLNYDVTQTDEAAAYLQRADTQSSALQSVPEASITAE
jgi:uncharacterized protein YjbI with pentapeptide repeats